MSMMDELQGLVADDMREKASSGGGKPEEGWWKMTIHSVQDVREDERETIKVTERQADGTKIEVEYPNPEQGDKIINLRMNLWAYGGTKWGANMTWEDMDKPRVDFIKLNPKTRLKHDGSGKLVANSNRLAKLQKLSGKTDLQDVIAHFMETPLYGRWQTNSFNEEANVLMDMKV